MASFSENSHIHITRRRREKKRKREKERERKRKKRGSSARALVISFQRIVKKTKWWRRERRSKRRVMLVHFSPTPLELEAEREREREREKKRRRSLGGKRNEEPRTSCSFILAVFLQLSRLSLSLSRARVVRRRRQNSSVSSSFLQEENPTNWRREKRKKKKKERVAIAVCSPAFLYSFLQVRRSTPKLMKLFLLTSNGRK